jgi:hypothetical protein
VRAKAVSPLRFATALQAAGAFINPPRSADIPVRIERVHTFERTGMSALLLTLELGPWNFSGAWSLEFGVSGVGVSNPPRRH